MNGSCTRYFLKRAVVDTNADVFTVLEQTLIIIFGNYISYIFVAIMQGGGIVYSGLAFVSIVDVMLY